MLHNNDSFILDKYTPNYLFSHNGNLDNSLRSCFPVLRGLEDINVLTFLPNNMARVFSKNKYLENLNLFYYPAGTLCHPAPAHLAAAAAPDPWYSCGIPSHAAGADTGTNSTDRNSTMWFRTSLRDAAQVC